MTEYELALNYYVGMNNFHTQEMFDENVYEFGWRYVKYYYIEYHNEEFGTDWELN